MKKRQIVFRFIPKPHEEAEENHDFKQDEFDLSEVMTKLDERVGMAAAGHTNLLETD